MTTVYVSNLPLDTSENELREMLEEVGGIRSIQILGDGGPAVCDFFDPAAAGVARRSVDGTLWHDSKLEVRYTYELSPQQRQPSDKAGSGLDNADSGAMDVESPDSGKPTETFASESTVSRIMQNLPGLDVDLNDTDAVSARFTELSSDEAKEILYAAQDAAMIDSKVFKDVLVEHPGLTRALFETQLNLDLVKVPEDRGVEVEGLMQQLLSMLKPKPPVRKHNPAPKQGAHLHGTGGKHNSRGGSRNRSFANSTKRSRVRHHSDRSHHQSSGHSSGRGHQSKYSSFSSSSRVPIQYGRAPQPNAGNIQSMTNSRSIQLTQSLHNYPGSAVHKAQVGQAQVPGQITLQHQVHLPQQGAGNIGAPLSSVIGGTMLVNPMHQQPGMQQLVQQQGGVLLNQLQVASRPQGPMIATNNQALAQGTWAPHDLSTIQPVRPPFGVPPLDTSGVYGQRAASNTTFGSVSVGQLAQQGWIVRPQAIPQQQVVLGPGQTFGTGFSRGVQSSRPVQGMTTDATAGQMAGVWETGMQQAVEARGISSVWQI